MKRNLHALSSSQFDLLVIGGGIYGACVAWEATLRGLSVALVEKSDFASGTSANSLKTVHGGLRYLQHGDFTRMRESICERKLLMQIAPHLVHPLPVLIPTYGYGLKGRATMSLALAINDLISSDRNWQADPHKYIPKGRILSKGNCLKLLPGIAEQNLTGGAVFYDAQIYNSERLVISFLRTAAQRGAELANYVEVAGFLQTNHRIHGVKAIDQLTRMQFNIQARMVINTSGPWINQVLRQLDSQQPSPPIHFAKAFNLVTRPLFHQYAVGLYSQRSYQDADALINKGTRLFFVAPWRGKSLIGTTYQECNQGPDSFHISEGDIQVFLRDFNQAYPAANLRYKDISFVQAGLLPVSVIDSRTSDIQLSKHAQIIDHRNQGIEGLISVVGVKYTTARKIAEKVVNKALRQLDHKPLPTASSQHAVYGGNIERFDRYLDAAIKEHSNQLDEICIRRLVYNYGTAYSKVLQYFDRFDYGDGNNKFRTLKAEIRYGVREEMAQKLSDIIFRRTELGSAGHPGEATLKTSAEMMGQEFGWSFSKIQQELQEVNVLINIPNAISSGG